MVKSLVQSRILGEKSENTQIESVNKRIDGINSELTVISQTMNENMASMLQKMQEMMRTQVSQTISSQMAQHLSIPRKTGAELTGRKKAYEEDSIGVSRGES